MPTNIIKVASSSFSKLKKLFRLDPTSTTDSLDHNYQILQAASKESSQSLLYNVKTEQYRPWQVLIAHAEGEEDYAEQLAEPIRHAGYEVVHRGTVMVGESVTEEASKVLSIGGPVILCGTIRALGTGWAHRLINAARQNPRIRIFAIQIEKDAYIQQLSLDGMVASYWQDPTKAIRDLVASLEKHYPLFTDPNPLPLEYGAIEQRYRELALESCDIIDLANLPENDRHIATRKLELRQLYATLRVYVEIASDIIVDDKLFEKLEEGRGKSSWDSISSQIMQIQREPVAIGHRLAEVSKLVVLGDPGAGKTTLLRWIATAYLLRLKQDPAWHDLPDVATLPDKDWLPIMVRCRDLNQPNMQGSLEDILYHILRRIELSDAETAAFRNALRSMLTRGKALLLIDGLDEIPDPISRARFCQQIEQIHIAYPNAPIIVTSRIVGYREMGYRIQRGFEHVTVAGLSTEDKDAFIHRWCALTELPERREISTAELLHDIHSTDRIERLTGNPMLLTTLALVKRKVGKLPSRRADLYWDALEVLLNWRREVDEPIDSREAIPQLEYVAYAMCERGIQQIREDELITLLENMREEYPQIHIIRNHNAEIFLRLLERRTGIIVEAGYIRHHGRPVPIFEFRHLTFQEYLAGLALVDGRFPGRDRSQGLAERIAPLAGRQRRSPYHPAVVETIVMENWREVLRLCVASCSDDNVDGALLAILTPLPEEDPEITSRSRSVMAALCLADEPNVTEQVAQAVLRELVKKVVDVDSHGILLPFSSSSDIMLSVRTTVGKAVLELERSAWRDKLKACLIEEFIQRDITTRMHLFYPYALLIASSVPDDPLHFDKWLHSQVSQIMPCHVDTAIEAVLSMLYVGSRLYPVPEIVKKLLDMLAWSAPAAHIASGVLAWISREALKDEAWYPSTTEAEKIIGVFSNPIIEVDTLHVLALILFRTFGIDPLLNLLDNKDPNTRCILVQVLGQSKDIRVVQALIAHLNDQDRWVQREAALALGQIDDSRATEVLRSKRKRSRGKLLEIQ